MFETDDDVPDDLVTSPLLAATKPGEANARPESTGRFGAKTSDESPSGDSSQEPDFLDLDGSASGEPVAGSSGLPISQPVSEASPEQGDQHESDGSTASSILSRTAEIGKAIVNKASEVTQYEKDKLKNETLKQATQELEKEEGTYIRNSLVSARNSASEYLPFGSQKGDEALPATSPVEGPDVRYTHGTHATGCRVSFCLLWSPQTWFSTWKVTMRRLMVGNDLKGLLPVGTLLVHQPQDPARSHPAHSRLQSDLGRPPQTQPDHPRLPHLSPSPSGPHLSPHLTCLSSTFRCHSLLPAGRSNLRLTTPLPAAAR